MPRQQQAFRGGRGRGGQRGRGQKIPTWTASLIKNSEDTAPKEKIIRSNFTGQTNEEAFGPAFLYEEPEMFEEKMQIPINTNSRVKYESSEEEDDNEGYDPMDICFECGKNLRGEYQCKRCYSPDTTEDDNEGYDPTDICFECGKNLRGENQCKRCFIPNTVEDEPEEAEAKVSEEDEVEDEDEEKVPRYQPGQPV